MKHLIRLALAAASIGGIAFAARAQETQLDVGVRAEIVDKPPAKLTGKLNSLEAPPHGKIYAILAVQKYATVRPMTKPVDANKLAELVTHELDTHGFQRVPKGQKPEILITVGYGRGRLRNPYRKEEGEEMPGAMSMPNGEGKGFDTPTSSVTGDAKQLFKEAEPGFEMKLQKADFEKICLRVTAWEYPKDPKAKAKELWRTVMYVDDPDNRDLNLVAAEMLAAGAPYFDHEIKQEEVDVYRPLPDGHVKVGTPEVVGSDVKKIE